MYKLALFLVLIVSAVSSAFSKETHFCSKDNVVLEADWRERNGAEWQAFDEFHSAALKNNLSAMQKATSEVDGSRAELNKLLKDDPDLYSDYADLKFKGLRPNQVSWGQYRIGVADISHFFGDQAKAETIICKDNGKCQYSLFASMYDQAATNSLGHLVDRLDASQPCEIDKTKLTLGATYLSPFPNQDSSTMSVYLDNESMDDSSAPAGELDAWLSTCRDTLDCELKKFIFTTYVVRGSASPNAASKDLESIDILDNPMVDEDFSLKNTNVVKYTTTYGDYYLFWLDIKGSGNYYYVVPIDLKGKFSTLLMTANVYSIFRTQEFARQMLSRNKN